MSLLAQHVELTIIAIVLAILIGIPLGIFISHYKSIRKYILGFINIVQAVPSMAFLGLLVPVLGIGSTPAIFMVVLVGISAVIYSGTIQNWILIFGGNDLSLFGIISRFIGSLFGGIL